jgi:hypothetical protein
MTEYYPSYEEELKLKIIEANDLRSESKSFLIKFLIQIGIINGREKDDSC